MKRKSFFIAILCGELLFAVWLMLSAPPQLTLESARLSEHEDVFARSQDVFGLTDKDDRKGITTYCGRERDQDGAGYAFRCRNGHAQSTQIIYAPSAVDRQTAWKAVQRVLPNPLAPIIEHDTAELNETTIPEPTEYVYLGNDYKVELGYQSRKPPRVAWVNVWIDKDREDRAH